MITTYEGLFFDPKGRTSAWEGDVKISYDGISICESDLSRGKFYYDIVLICLTNKGDDLVNINLLPDEAIEIANEIIRRANSLKQREGGMQ